MLNSMRIFNPRFILLCFIVLLVIIVFILGLHDLRIFISIFELNMGRDRRLGCEIMLILIRIILSLFSNRAIIHPLCSLKYYDLYYKLIQYDR